MIRELIVRPEAEQEMRDAYGWYEARQTGLGEDFLEMVDAVLCDAIRNPAQYPIVHNGIRRALTKRFPYQVFFVEGETRVTVLAVFHTRRNPRGWQERKCRNNP